MAQIWVLGVLLAAQPSVEKKVDTVVRSTAVTRAENDPIGAEITSDHRRYEVDPVGIVTVRRRIQVHVNRADPDSAITDYQYPWDGKTGERPEVIATIDSVDGIKRVFQSVRLVRVERIDESSPVYEWYGLTLKDLRPGDRLQLDARYPIDAAASPFSELQWSAKLRDRYPSTRATIEVVTPKGFSIVCAPHGAKPTSKREFDSGSKRVLQYSFEKIAEYQSVPWDTRREYEIREAVDCTTFKSWSSLSRALFDRIPLVPVSDEIVTAVNRLGPFSSDQWETAKKIHRWIVSTISLTDHSKARQQWRSPRAILESKNGSARDRTMLLVSMLNAAGVDALLALRPRMQRTVNPLVPGLFESHDEFVWIRSLPNGRGWFDPTLDGWAGAGYDSVQDRDWILPIGEKVEGLMTLPTRQRKYSWEQDVFISEKGEIKERERFSMTGPYAHDWRMDREKFVGTDAEWFLDHQKRFERQHAPLKLISMELSANPWSSTTSEQVMESLELENDGDRRYFENRNVLVEHDYFIPDVIDVEDGDGVKVDEFESNDAPPVSMGTSVVFAAGQKITLADGMRFVETPANVSIRTEGFRYEQRFRLEPDGTMRISTDLVVPEQLSRASVVKLRAEFAARRKAAPTRIIVESKAEVLFGRGDHVGASRELQRLMARNPTKAWYFAKFASLQHDMGLSDAALVSATRAVELEPNYDWAHVMRGLIASGWSGRPFRNLGVYPLIMKEEGKWLIAHGRTNFGEFGHHLYSQAMQLDSAGKPIRSGAQHGEVAEYAKKAVGEGERLDYDYFTAMAFAEKFEELRVESRTYRTDQERTIATLVAESALAGGAKAIEAIRGFSMTPEERARRLNVAANILGRIGRYAEMKILLAASRDLGNGGAGGILRETEGIERHDKLKLNTREPKDFLRWMRIQCALPGTGDAVLSRVEPLMFHGNDKDENLKRACDLVASERLVHGRLDDVDFAARTFPSTVECVANVGCRVTEQQAYRSMTYWTRTDKTGNHRLLGTNRNLGAVARLLLSERTTTESFKVKVRWMRELLLGGRTEFGSSVRAQVVQFAPDDVQQLDTLAAIALAWDGFARESVPLLRSVLNKVPQHLRPAYQYELMKGVLRSEPFEAFVAEIDRVVSEFPVNVFRDSVIVEEYLARNRVSDATRWWSARRSHYGNVPGAIRVDLVLALHAQDVRRFEKAAELLRANPDTTDGDYNALAWAYLAMDLNATTAVELARKSVTKNEYPANLHTLSLALAAAGQLGESQELFISALDKRYTEPLRPDDWLVLGRIAETLEIFTEAERIYASIKPVPGAPTGPDSVVAFAKAGLARVRARMAAAPK